MKCWNPHDGDTEAETVYRGYALCVRCLNLADEWPDEDLDKPLLFEWYLLRAHDPEWADKTTREVREAILQEAAG